MVGIPLALALCWSYLAHAAMMPLPLWRLLDEERIIW